MYVLNDLGGCRRVRSKENGRVAVQNVKQDLEVLNLVSIETKILCKRTKVCFFKS